MSTSGRCYSFFPCSLALVDISVSIFGFEVGRQQSKQVILSEKVEQWRCCIVLLFSPLIIAVLTLWMFLHSMLAVNMLHLSLVSVCAILHVTIQFRFLGVAVIRPILVVLLHNIFPYPRWRRWFAIFFICAGETALFVLWIPRTEVWFPVLLASCWLLLVSESWIPTSEAQMKEAEKALLRAHGISAQCTKVAGLSMLEVMPPPVAYGAESSRFGSWTTLQDRPVLVLCHGYASGKALWGPALVELARHFRVYTIDWLGFARSTRRKAFVAKNVEETHDYFVGSLELWRKTMGLEKMALLGHSMGGYLCGIYAVRYPHRITRLYLASPVGVPHKDETPRTMMSPTFRFLGVLWDMGVTPIQLIRFLGPLGPSFLRFACALRWGSVMTQEQIVATANYIWHVNAGPPCSDQAIVRILRVGAWSRQALGPILTQLQVPVTFLYGESDWMGYEHSLPVVDALHQQRRQQVRNAWEQKKQAPQTPTNVNGSTGTIVNGQSTDLSASHAVGSSGNLLDLEDPSEGASTRDNLFNGHARVYLVREAGHQLFIMNGLACARIVIHDAAVLPGVPKLLTTPSIDSQRGIIAGSNEDLATGATLGRGRCGPEEPLLQNSFLQESEKLLDYERMPEVHPGLYRV
eukprot:g75594.t1